MGLGREVEVDSCPRVRELVSNYGLARTWERVIAVGEVGGTSEKFCQLASAPQEMLPLVRRKSVRGGRRLGKGDDGMRHGRPAAGRRREAANLTLRGGRSYG